SKPRLADIDRDGAPEMFIGGDQGFLEMYTNLTAGLNAQLVAQPTPFNVDFGSFSAPAIAKIDSSDNYTFVIGSIRGGLQLLQAEQTGNPPLSAGPNPQDKSPLLFPNPTTGQLSIRMQTPVNASFSIALHNRLGQTILERESTATQLALDLRAYPSGIYFVQIKQGAQSWTQKLVLQ
ncbi:MAG: T9SS type A sorting domain-containing protein, partial [Bacteroidota bacterium]